MEAARLLVVDDEVSILETLRIGLSYHGYEVREARNIDEAMQTFRQIAPDLVILDVMLPDGSGLDMCAELRGESDVPVLLLTARTDVDDKVAGLECGADDYLTKPFTFKELLARVRALLRRAGLRQARTMTFEDVQLDLSTREVKRSGLHAELTVREFELLKLLMRRPYQVVSREDILARLWGAEFTGNTNIVEVHMSSLRSKLGDTRRRLIRTVRGYGYTLWGSRERVP